jgi:hypothetical protein
MRPPLATPHFLMSRAPRCIHGNTPLHFPEPNTPKVRPSYMQHHCFFFAWGNAHISISTDAVHPALDSCMPVDVLNDIDYGSKAFD